MTDFHHFAVAVHEQFNRISDGELFTVDKGEIFDAYLAAFPQGSNEIFRERTQHDCSCCKHFVRNLGHVVAIRGGKVVTVWDVDGLEHPYDVVAATMADIIRSKPITGVFRTNFQTFGSESTKEFRDGAAHTWHHFWARVHDRHMSNDAATQIGRINSARDVFERGLKELSPQAVTDVIDLVEQNALYRGEEHLRALQAFRDAQSTYRQTPSAARALYAWEYVHSPAARFRNTVIGTLVQDLSEGVDLERAVKSFETKVAPYNYKRPTALITPRMIDNALATLRDLGLESAIERRHARIEDVSVNDVIWANQSAKQVMRDGLKGALMEEVRTAPVKLDNATPIDIGSFVADVLPTAREVKLLVQNRHAGNFVSITAPVHPDAGRLFRWDNNFAWSYDGEVADTIKQKVKSAGGNISADLRISLAWSNTDDLDIHCVAPGYGHIFFGDKKGVLDVDMNVHGETRDPVENLAFMRPKDGEYLVIVHNYRRREDRDTGFSLQVESNGEVHDFSSLVSPKHQRDFQCLKIGVAAGRIEKIEVTDQHIMGGGAQRQHWSVTTETLVPVKTVMLSPNHWGDNAVGNRHWFFMLDGCNNPEPVRGIYNEFLAPALEPHRKVFEVLGAKTKCPPADEQLSGVGFSSTRGDKVVAVVSDSAKTRAYNISM